VQIENKKKRHTTKCIVHTLRDTHHTHGRCAQAMRTRNHSDNKGIFLINDKFKIHNMKQIYLVLLSFVILSSCDKENDYAANNANIGLIEIPLNDSIDINNDNKTDFAIIYNDLRRLSGPSHAEFVTGSILPFESNKLLYQNQADLLFLEANDTIRKNDNTNSMWTDFAPTILHIHVSNGNWDENWTVLSSISSDYYVGIKLSINDTVKIGWLLIDINTNNGKISVLDSRLSTASELIIE
jgi:hypothetical protein